MFWTRPQTGVNAAQIAQWAQADAPRHQPCAELPAGAFHTRPGVFALDRADAASTMLAGVLPPTLRGKVSDFGEGRVYLSINVLGRCPQFTSLDVYEAGARALTLAPRNLADACMPVDVYKRQVCTHRD